MIAIVEVDVCYHRPPVVQGTHRVVVAGETEVECMLTACMLVAATHDVVKDPESKKAWEARQNRGPRRPVAMVLGSRIIELLEY